MRRSLSRFPSESSDTKLQQSIALYLKALSFSVVKLPVPFLLDRFVGRMIGGRMAGTAERRGRELTNSITRVYSERGRSGLVKTPTAGRRFWLLNLQNFTNPPADRSPPVLRPSKDASYFAMAPLAPGNPCSARFNRHGTVYGRNRPLLTVPRPCTDGESGGTRTRDHCIILRVNGAFAREHPGA